MSSLRRSVVDTDTRTGLDLRNPDSALLYPQPCRSISLLAVEFLIYSQMLGQFSRSWKFFDSSDQDSRRMIPGPSDDIQHMIHSIDHIDVPIAGMAEHRRVALRLAMPCMARFVFLPVIRFHLGDDISFIFDHEKLAEQVFADADRITVEERSGQDLAHGLFQDKYGS